MTPIPSRRAYQQNYYRTKKAERAAATATKTAAKAATKKASNDKNYNHDKAVAAKMGIPIVSILQCVIVVAIRR